MVWEFEASQGVQGVLEPQLEREVLELVLLELLVRLVRLELQPEQVIEELLLALLEFTLAPQRLAVPTWQQRLRRSS